MGVNALKRILAILILVLAMPMARATATFDAEYGRYAKIGTGTSDSLVVSNTIAAGKALMIPVVNEANSKNLTGFSDPRGNTYTKIGITNVSTVHNLEFWYCLVTTTIQVGDTITANWSSSEDTSRGFILWGWNGIVTSSAIDVSLTTRATFGSTVDKSITTTIAGDACAYAVVIQGNKAYTPAGGTTQIGAQLLVGYVPASTVGLLLTTGYQIQTSTGSFSPAGSIVPDDTALVILVSVKAAVTHTYFVDFVGGDDTHAGTAQGTAWKHCYGDTNATSTAAGTPLVAGDTVIFKGGVVYTGDIAIKVAGASGLPILYDGAGATWGTGLAKMDCNATYYHAFSAPSAKDYIWIKGFDIYNAKNKSNKTNQTITRAGSDITGVNYGGNGDIDSEPAILDVGGDFWWISDGRIHDSENCYDLSVQGAETDSDTQTDINVPCDKKAIKLYNNANNCVISNMVCWATGRDIFGLQGTTNTLVINCNGGGDSSVTATNKGWFAVFARLAGSGTGAPTAWVTFQNCTVHEGWQYGGDDPLQRSHANDWFHAFGDADAVLESDSDTHDILFDRVYCYNDHKFVYNNGTATFFIESDCYNFEWRNVLSVNDFAGCIEMRDCSNMVVNASTIISDNTQPILFKAKSEAGFPCKALRVRNCVFVSQSGNSANVAMGTSGAGYDGEAVDSDYNLYYVSAHNNRIEWHGTNYTSLSAWRAQVPGVDTHSIFADPKLVSLPTGSGWNTASSGDYRANSSQSSPLIAAGLDQSSTFAIFRDGTSRTAPWIIGSETSFAGGGGGSSPATVQFMGGLNIRGVIFR